MRQRRNFKVLCDASLVFAARMLCDAEGIGSRSALWQNDNGLYQTLRKRKLLDAIGLGSSHEGHRDWASMSDEGLVHHAKDLIREEGIKGRIQLMRLDPGLYNVLLKRDLVGRTGLEPKRRNWEKLSDEQVLASARRLISERGIMKRSELERADKGLYHVLLNRRIMDGIGLGRALRDWSQLSDAELVFAVRMLVDATDIRIRADLLVYDSSIYQVVSKRKLLGDIFEPYGRSWGAESVRQVVKALEEFR